MIYKMSRTDDEEFDYRTLLEQEAASLLSKLGEIGYSDIGGTGLEYDSNFADSSQVSAEKSETESMVGELRSALLDVKDALARMENGTYGICQGCGNTISPSRLEALPAVKYCITCASENSKKIGK